MKMMISVIGLLAFALSTTGCGGGTGDAGSGEKSGAGTAPTAPAESTSVAIPAEVTSPSPEAAPTAPPAPTTPAPTTPAPTTPGPINSPPAEDTSTADESGSQGSADEMMESYLESFNEITAAFKTVSDEETAKAAGQTIQEIVVRMNRQAEEWKKVPKAELAATSARYSQQMRDAEGKLTQALLPVMMNQTFAPHVKDAMQGLPTFPTGR